MILNHKLHVYNILNRVKFPNILGLKFEYFLDLSLQRALCLREIKYSQKMATPIQPSYPLPNDIICVMNLVYMFTINSPPIHQYKGRGNRQDDFVVLPLSDEVPYETQ